ncbi:MAG: FHA domain-containing protein [Acidimicrobiia bacterium]
MVDIVCARCGHRNAPGGNFCSSCGAPLDTTTDHPTMSVAVPVESPDEEVVVDLGELPSGVGMLVVTRGANAGSRYALDQDVVTAGRHPDSDIFLDDITVSRRHAELVRAPVGYVVRDAGSLNGTYLNRERVEQAELHDGDELQVGSFKLVFLAGHK